MIALGFPAWAGFEMMQAVRQSGLLVKEVVTLAQRGLPVNAILSGAWEHCLKYAVTNDAHGSYSKNWLLMLLSSRDSTLNPRSKLVMTRIIDEEILYVKIMEAGFDMHICEKLFGLFHRLHRSANSKGRAWDCNIRRIFSAWRTCLGRRLS
jgi:hypothetical protein